MRVLLFSDGRPGHVKQSRALVAALRRYAVLEVDEVDVARLRFTAGFLAHCRYFFHLPDRRRDIPGGELLIGAGRHTHLPMLLHKRRTGARTVVCMDPGRLLRTRFDLCCIPLHDRVAPADNVILTVGPPAASAPAGEKDPRRALVLVGGVDPRSHVWEEDTITARIGALIDAEPDKQWIIASSPRTPESTEALLLDIARDRAGVRFVPFAATGDGWVDRQYAVCGTVWVTADSMSMVYEALSAGCRVGILPVAWKRGDNKFRRSLASLVDRNMVMPYERLRDGSGEWRRSAPLDEADRCAREIMSRWWPTHLP